MSGRQPAQDDSDPGVYGRSFADVYDQWYATAFETPSAVRSLERLAGEGPVLELGVGTGRLAIPLAESGLRVVGLDASSEMLEQLRLNDARSIVVGVHGDMSKASDALETAGISETFSLVFCAFNTLLNLESRESITECLAQCRKVLGTDGRIAIESLVPVDADVVPAHSLSPARVRSDAAVFIESRFDARTSLLRGRHIEVRPGTVRVRPWKVLLHSPADLDESAIEAGLVPIDRWSDWSGSPFDEESSTHISIYGSDPTLRT